MRARRATVAAAVALVASAGSAAAADPVLPLSQVTPGMVGEARTVVRGTQIVTFPVTVIDVQQAFDGPGGSLVLVRAGGPLMDETGGVAEGMSGSPVYVTGADGVPRVMGAIAYGTGDQQNVVVGVTPIEQMIDSSGRGQRATEAAAAPARRAVRVGDRAAARRLERLRPDRIGLYPLARWTVSGASRPLIGPLARELGRSGIRLSSVGPRTPRAAVALEPGSSMSVLLAGGDLALGAVGTVTYVDGATVLGFGHPFLGAGSARFLLGDAWVFQTIAAPIVGASYKFAEPGAMQGMVTDDRSDGITGVVGPVDAIRAVGSAVDAGRGIRRTVRATIAPDDRTAPIVAGLVQDEPAFRARDGIEGGTITLRVVLRSPDLSRPIVYRNVYAAAGDVLTLASGQVPRLMSILLQNSVRRIPVASVSVTQRIETRVRASRIVGATIRPRTARPGSTATLLVRLQPWQGAPRTVRARIRVPGGLWPGRTLRVVPNSSGGFDSLPADLTQEIGASSALSARTRAVRLAEGGARRARGSRLERILEGLRRATDDRNDAVRLLGPGEDGSDPEAGTTVPMPDVIYGGRAAVRLARR